MLAAIFVVVAFSSALYYWNGTTGEIGEVEWSPLYGMRERTALAPITSQPAQAQPASLAGSCAGQSTCDATCMSTCPATCDGYTCERTCNTCKGPTCDSTCQTTCQATCDGYTCEGTCDGYTCEGTCYGHTCDSTCDGTTCEGTCESTCWYTCDRTCDGGTCEGTCDGHTCDGSTCEGTCYDLTCEGTCDEHTCQMTCDGYTCSETCDGYTCEASCDGYTCEETCDGYTCEETCEGSTCEEGGTCDGSTCPAPTCVGVTCGDFRTCDTCEGMRTCDSYTCEGVTCDGRCGSFTFEDRTCRGPTCDGPSCGDRTCDPIICELPTIEGRTCERPTCDGPTCEGETCEGNTCFDALCAVWDFGDAPDRSIPGPHRFLTTLSDDGARHLVDGVFYLGERIDEEADGQPNDFAYGDDTRPWSVRDDEDGVWFPTSLVPGRQAILIVDASREGFLHGWIDYDESGAWDVHEERLFEPSLLLRRGFNWIVFEVPEDAVAPEISYARFRFGTEEFLETIGEAHSGEVEDYREAICPTYDVWIMTDDIVYARDESVDLTFYVDSVSQVEILRHRPDGETTLFWAGTVEAGLHEISDHGRNLRAFVLGTETIEMIATSVQGECTTWVTTPYVVVAP